MASHDAQPETAQSSESVSRPETSTARQNTNSEATRGLNQTAKQKVDFSIDGLLSDRTSTTQSSFKVDLEFSPGAEECSEKASPDDRSSRFDWLQCSRYKPPKLPRRREFPRRRYLGRNPRIPFTGAQVSALEAHFLANRYLSGAQVHRIAHNLGLTETRVKIWFQNRRAREKRERPPATLTNAHVDETSVPRASAAVPGQSGGVQQQLRPFQPFSAGVQSSANAVLSRVGASFLPFAYWPPPPPLPPPTSWFHKTEQYP